MYQQLSLDYKGTNVYVASARPGVVKTEGLLDHVVKANSLELPHSEYFNNLLQGNGNGKSGQMQEVDVVAEFFVLSSNKMPKGRLWQERMVSESKYTMVDWFRESTFVNTYV